jgi:fluoroacetyl-CoA thioesterase
MAKDSEPLAEGSFTMRVRPSDLASTSVPGQDGRFPEVLATTRMILAMEVAAGNCLAPLIEDGELSVGVVVNVQHLAATPPGADITAHARYLGRAGKLYRFEVTATDPGGEIGRGEHQRAIIKRDRLLAGAAKRRGAE